MSWLAFFIALKGRAVGRVGWWCGLEPVDGGFYKVMNVNHPLR